MDKRREPLHKAGIPQNLRAIPRLVHSSISGLPILMPCSRGPQIVGINYFQ